MGWWGSDLVAGGILFYLETVIFVEIKAKGTPFFIPELLATVVGIF
jgi:hypothetical protein